MERRCSVRVGVTDGVKVAEGGGVSVVVSTRMFGSGREVVIGTQATRRAMSIMANFIGMVAAIISIV